MTKETLKRRVRISTRVYLSALAALMVLALALSNDIISLQVGHLVVVAVLLALIALGSIATMAMAENKLRKRKQRPNFKGSTKGHN